MLNSVHIRITLIRKRFIAYQETGRDWVQCPCGRWTPEDCVEDSVTDVDGKERFCLVATVTDINLFGTPYYAVYSILHSSQIYGG